jgi:hypothetical protein
MSAVTTTVTNQQRRFSGHMRTFIISVIIFTPFPPVTNTIQNVSQSRTRDDEYIIIIVIITIIIIIVTNSGGNNY